MYCKCKEPKKKTILIMNNEVDVCAKSIGGCGQEVKESQDNDFPVKWSAEPYMYMNNTNDEPIESDITRAALELIKMLDT